MWYNIIVKVKIKWDDKNGNFGFFQKFKIKQGSGWRTDKNDRRRFESYDNGIEINFK